MNRGGGARGDGGRGGGGRGGGRRPEGQPEYRGGGGRGSGGRSAGYATGPSSETYPPLSSSAVPYAPVAAQSPAIRSSVASSSGSTALTAGVERISLQSTTETATVTNPAVNLPPTSKKLAKMPPRPGFGTIGQKVVIRANHFLVEVSENRLDLHHYDVAISPEVTSKKVNRDIVVELVRLYKESHLGKRTPAYDGRKSLYTAGPLPFTSKDFIVKLVDSEKPPGSTRREREFKVAIKFAAKADLHHLSEFIKGRQRDCPHETIQALDVVLRETPSKKYTVVTRSFFSPELGAIGQLGDGLEYWKGYYQSLRPTQMGLSLNIDVSARAFYEPVPVTEFVAKSLNLRELNWPLLDRDRLKVSKLLKGLRVEPNHTEHVRRYKVTGLSVHPADQLMFSNDDGKVQSVAQYFGEKYGRRLRFPFLPCVQAGNSSKPIYLPMEVCKITKGQRFMKKLNEKQVTAMLKATCQRPGEREKTIEKIAKTNRYNDSDGIVTKDFGIGVKEELTTINARVLPPPRLKYHESGKESNVDPRVGQWNMINKKMVNGATVDYWSCVSFSARMREDMVHEFCSKLIGMCMDKGMRFNPDPLIPVQRSDARQMEKSLVRIHKESVAKLASIRQSDKHLQLLIIILPDVRGSYGLIKRVCETELGIVSQCCQPMQAQKMNVQYLENVSLKMNVKVGGRNTVLSDFLNRRVRVVSDRPTIIFGADVTHPNPGEDSSPSIAAVVASMDWPEITKYRALVSSQPHRVEMIEDLYRLTVDPKRGNVHGGMIREHLIAFRKATGQKPHRIIFYRDGVSEGQFAQVLYDEMDAIRKACASLESGYMPPVTFIVVQKRHHTRFFTSDRNQQDRSGNVLPGTVVDTKICHPTEFDFYLNSHAGIQGTSRPAHYHVLFDENNFDADQLQSLTNNLCYTYARCTRSVSIVPPAYYAHLAAFRARYYCEGVDASDSGSTSVGGRNTRDGTAAVRALPAIKDCVKDVMFYC